MWTSYDYKIADSFLSALINDDFSGLEDSEAKELREWIADQEQHARNNRDNVSMHWDCDDSADDFGRCDVTGLFANRAEVRLMVYVKE